MVQILSFLSLQLLLIFVSSAPLFVKEHTLCVENYEGYKILQLKIVDQDWFDHVTQVLDDLQSMGEIQILSVTGHKEFIFGYQVNVLIPRYLTLSDEVYIETLRRLYDGGKNVFDLGDLIPITKSLADLEVVPPKILQSDTVFGFDSYHTYHSLNNHLEELCHKYSDVMELFDLEGTTYEGRNIRAVRITNNPGRSRDKPMIYLEGGIHSREWISPATLIYLIESLIGHREKNNTAQTAFLRDTFQFVVIPVANPDGYIHSQSERMWRKTRRPSGCLHNLRDCDGGCLLKECYGVDPNRNWDIDFGMKGVSSEPCDVSFAGRAPFNQNCVVMIRDFLVANADKLVLSITYHSFSQLFLYPWGRTQESTSHLDHHMKVGEAFSRAVAARHGSRYKNNPIVKIYNDKYPNYWYEVSGTSIDWIYQNLGLVDSYGVELRDEGEYGFQLPPEQILPTGEENFDGLLAVIRNLDYFNRP